MKREYRKPYLLVESFQLDAAIAAACSEDGKMPINYGLDTCRATEEDPGMTYIGNMCIHDVKVEGDGNDLICYHGPMVDFNSTFLAS